MRPLPAGYGMHTSLYASRECGGVDVKDSATSFPPPLRGRDRERGRQQALRLPSIRYCILSMSKARDGIGIDFGASLPPPSLSLPRKGGGNDVAPLCPSPATYPRSALRCVHALAPMGRGSHAVP